MVDYKNLKAHPAADIYPRMTDSDLESLANNIKKSGQTFPIVVVKVSDDLLKKGGEYLPDAIAGEEFLILDGRNRHAAYSLSILAGVEPWIVMYEGDLTPTDYVRSVNWERMHLSPKQRAALAVSMMPKAAEEARVRQLGVLKYADVSLAQICANDTYGKTSELVAKMMTVSTRSVEQAARIKKEDPIAFERLKENNSPSLNAVYAALPSRKQTKAAIDAAHLKELNVIFAGIAGLKLDVDALPPMNIEDRGNYLSVAVQLQQSLAVLIKRLQE